MWLRSIILLVLSLTALQAATITGLTSGPNQSSGSVVFSDNFGSYQATATCNSVNDGCDAPPHVGDKVNLPAYWVPASSNTCTTRGGCTQWDGNAHMGPNSVFAVVDGEISAPPGSSSPNVMKLGASDWYADKTSMAVWLSLSDFPPGQLVSFTFSVWLSTGIDNAPCHCNPYGSGPNNALTIQLPIGKMRYEGQVENDSGLWEIQGAPSTTGGAFTDLCCYHLTTQTWHTLTFTFDWTNNVWNAFVVDGQQPFASVHGYPTFDSTAQMGYYDFAVFIDPFADYQSITSAPSHGFQPFYAYVDDVQVSLGAVNSTSQISSTSTTTTTAPIPEFGAATTVIVSTALIVAALHLNVTRRNRRKLLTAKSIFH